LFAAVVVAGLGRALLEGFFGAAESCVGDGSPPQPNQLMPGMLKPLWHPVEITRHANAKPTTECLKVIRMALSPSFDMSRRYVASG
jgi:hypothetical protein